MKTWLSLVLMAGLTGGYLVWAPPRTVAQAPRTLTCRSTNFRYQFCPINTRGGVRLGRQLSDTRCTLNTNWGYDNRGIWVDRGCAGEFLIGLDRQEEVIRCESRNNRRADCSVNTRGARVTLRRQLSDARCTQNRTWGYDDRGIWVANGCRGDFLVRR